MPCDLILIGERDLGKPGHVGIEKSFEFFRAQHGSTLNLHWVRTAQIDERSVSDLFADAAGIWCVPGSPYENTDGALFAIRHARQHRIPFLGTCGGFQHAIMEFAQNVLGRHAEHAEMSPNDPTPLISKLTCSLVGAQGRVTADPASDFSKILGGASSLEVYHCNYGLAEALRPLFANSDLRFVAHDELGQVRAFQLRNHPFFVGTLFQPERRALRGELHPLVRAFFFAADTRRVTPEWRK